MKVCCKLGFDIWLISIDLNINCIYVESVNLIGEKKIVIVIIILEIKNYE